MSISTPAERLEPVLTRIEEQRDAALADVQRFCRQPSISAQGQGMREMAQLVVESLHEWSGYQGPGGKTVLPARAGAKLDFRPPSREDLSGKLGDLLSVCWARWRS